MDTTLAHDSFLRYHAILALAGRLDLPSHARVLDVGGYPGTLRRQLIQQFPGWDVTVVDSARGRAESYLTASGTALPLAADSFDLVVSSDTLEHVPPAVRPAFLGELARVSRNAVIVGAPFHQRVTAFVEKSLNLYHLERTGRPHPWLGEHVENSLPLLDETHRALSSDRPTAVFLNAPLMEWMMWQWMSLGSELGSAYDDAWKETNRQLNETLEPRGDLLWPIGSAPGVMAYRGVVVAARKMPFAPQADPATMPQDDLYAERLVAWSGMMQALLEALRAGGSADPSAAINDRLVRALELSERSATPASRGLLARLLGR